MKKYLFFLLPLSLYSSNINFEKVFVTQISSDMLSTKITITTSNNNSDDIETIFEKYIDIFKTNNLESIINKKQITTNFTNQSSYNGILTYTIKTYSFEKLDSFIKELLYLKDEKNLNIKIQSPKAILSENLQEQSIHNLRVKAINFSKTYENRLSKDLNKICLTKDIKIKDEKIINNDTNILKLFVNYKLECQ
jgi:hypothetical protein